MQAATTHTIESTNIDVISRNLQHIHHANFLIKSVHNPTRQGIMTNLLRGGSFSVYELCDMLNVEQSMMSQHLSILRRANLVNTKRKGKFIYYSMNEKNLVLMMQYIKNMAS